MIHFLIFPATKSQETALPVIRAFLTLDGERNYTRCFTEGGSFSEMPGDEHSVPHSGQVVVVVFNSQTMLPPVIMEPTID